MASVSILSLPALSLFVVAARSPGDVPSACTDGIALDQRATGGFSQRAVYAVRDDQELVAFDWRDMASTLNSSPRETHA